MFFEFTANMFPCPFIVFQDGILDLIKASRALRETRNEILDTLV